MAIALQDYLELMEMEGYQKIGFHVGSGGGNQDGIGDYFRALDAAGKPACLMSADDYGTCGELAALSRASGVPHVIVYRNTGFDTPVYSVDPDVAGHIMLQQHMAELPPEFDRDKVWYVFINEPNKELADWLGQCAYYMAQETLDLGIKAAFLGWSTGTPEFDDWQTPGMIDFLELCGENPHMLAVALHEYSLNDDIRSGYPYLVGRVHSHLFAACDEIGVPRPTVLISEWGWHESSVPEPAPAMVDIQDIADDYVKYPNILMAGIWYLGPKYGGIADDAQKLIAPVTELSVNYEAPAPPPPPPVVMAQGVDISHWQGEMDWDKCFDRGARFAFIKCTEGTSYADPRFLENWGGASDAGIYRGGYHYFRSMMDPVAQAQHFVSHLPPDTDLPPVIDLEDPRDIPADLAERVALFLATVEQEYGIAPIIYTGNWYWNAYMGDPDWAVNYDLWIANWTHDDEPVIPDSWDYWVFWQHTSNGAGRDWGAQSNTIDLNRFMSDEDDLTHYVNSLVTPDPCFEIEPFTRNYILHPTILNAEQRVWIDGAMTDGVLVDDELRVIGVAGWSLYDGMQNILDAVWVGKEDSRLLILDGEQIGSGLTPIWMRDNCPTLVPFTRWYHTSDTPPPPPPPPPPPAPHTDLVPYLITNQAKGPLYEVQTQDGPQQRHQTHVEGYVFYFTKGGDGPNFPAEWEELSYDDLLVYRRYDTSHGDGIYYQLSEPEGNDWSRWCPRFMAKNEPYWRRPYVQFFNKANCVEIDNGHQDSNITLIDVHREYRFFTGIVLSDVIEMHVRGGGLDERYWFAKGFGLVGWQNPGTISAISEIHAPGARPDSVREDIPCLSA